MELPKWKICVVSGIVCFLFILTTGATKPIELIFREDSRLSLNHSIVPPGQSLTFRKSLVNVLATSVFNVFLWGFNT